MFSLAYKCFSIINDNKRWSGLRAGRWERWPQWGGRAGEGGGQHRKPWFSVTEFFNFFGRQIARTCSRYDLCANPTLRQRHNLPNRDSRTPIWNCNLKPRHGRRVDESLSRGKCLVGILGLYLEKLETFFWGFLAGFVSFKAKYQVNGRVDWSLFMGHFILYRFPTRLENFADHVGLPRWGTWSLPSPDVTPVPTTISLPVWFSLVFVESTTPPIQTKTCRRPSLAVEF